ncbi:hypothetical protein L6E12_20380 [Actinokineospora sp. PR83]|uniref:hypothetical protein n=1 Tax=Actinokineospora sp. PR83 TaxID=2884908 RepID=UPI001F35EBE5|nr:hypothetical protein [Actinokineospora sp. PR83]MCG8918143.1 hypothetical protein [Actinokineospora sp. PR83]
MNPVLFVNARRTHLERGAAFEAAQRAGHPVVLLADRVPGGLPASVTPIQADTAALTDVDIGELGRHRFAGVLAWSDGDVRTASRIATRPGLPDRPAAAGWAKGKSLVRAAVAAADPAPVLRGRPRGRASGPPWPRWGCPGCLSRWRPRAAGASSWSTPPRSWRRRSTCSAGSPG